MTDSKSPQNVPLILKMTLEREIIKNTKVKWDGTRTVRYHES